VTTTPASTTAITSTTPVPSVKGQTIAQPSNRLRFADVGINLTDDVFRGKYHGKQVHEDDTEHVLQRAVEAGCIKFMVTGSDLQESRKAVQLAEKYPGLCYATVGVHPCSARSFDTHPGGGEKLLEELEELATEAVRKGRASAFGEIGLDYDRLSLSPKDQQRESFSRQLDLAVKLQLPLFLHSRAAHEDFVRLLEPRLRHLPNQHRGLVHSFTGTVAEMHSLLSLGLDIGINGCSLKTGENIAVVRALPLERLQIETDGPWCEMRASHASAEYKAGAMELPKAVKKEKWDAECMVKGRTEPVAIVQVAHVVAGVKGLGVEEVAERAWGNSVRMFGLGEGSSPEGL